MTQDQVLKYWDTTQNAAMYKKFSQKYGYYRKAGEELAAAACILSNHHVVDLGCGTGISTRPIVSYVGKEGSIVGIDPAGCMIECAVKQKWPENVMFTKGDIHSLEAITPDNGFDRILCSSAVWLMPDRVLMAKNINQILAKDGLFAFTIPAELIGKCGHLLEKPARQFWETFTNVRESLNIDPPAPIDKDPDEYTIDSWVSALKRACFGNIEIKEFAYELNHEEWLAHISIPAILQNYLPSASDIKRDEFLKTLKIRIDPDSASERRWVIITAYPA